MCARAHTNTHTHRTESISDRQLPQSERPRGRREVCCVPETLSCATPSCSPAGSPVTSYNGEALTPSSERQKEMVSGPTNWLAKEMRGWVNKRKEEWCGKLCAHKQGLILCVVFFWFFFFPLQEWCELTGTGVSNQLTHHNDSSSY